MKRKVIFCLLPLLLPLTLVSPAKAQNEDPEIVLQPNDRVMVLAPHPDDEVIACGGILQKAARNHLPVQVVFLTNGDNYEWAFMLYKKHPVLEPSALRKMGLVRHDEALAAAQILGISTSSYVFLGYPDWGTEKIWMEHWGSRQPPFRSLLTRVTDVPYASAFDPGAAYKGESLLSDLEKIVRDFKPTKIFVSHPADAHRDHRSFYLFAQIALWDLSQEIHPTMYTYLVHYPHWPRPHGFNASRLLEPPSQSFIPLLENNPLTPEEVLRKKSAIEAHQSQMAKDARYLYSFVASNELFEETEEIQLQPNRSPQVVVPREVARHVPKELEEPPLDVDWRYAHLEGNSLVMQLDVSKPILAVGQTARIALFGYRHDKPFAEMPKLRLTISHQRLHGQDQTLDVDVRRIGMVRRAHQISLTIPLDLLGNPEKIIGTAWSRTAKEPFDARAWRALEISSP